MDILGRGTSGAVSGEVIQAVEVGADRSRLDRNRIQGLWMRDTEAWSM